MLVDLFYNYLAKLLNFRHGKTTLLRHIAIKALKIPASIDILYCEQEVAPEPISAVSVVLKADVKRDYLLKECKELEEKLDKGVSQSLELLIVIEYMHSTVV